MKDYARRLAYWAAVIISSVSCENLADAQGQAAMAEVCVSFNPSSLSIAHSKSGFSIKSAEGEIPISFADPSGANALLEEGRRHTGVCWIESIADDLKQGNDVYLSWQAGVPKFATPLIPLLPNSALPPALYRTGATCRVHSSYVFERSVGKLPAGVRDGDMRLLSFGSNQKALRAYRDLSEGSQVPELCEISITSAAGTKIHPLVAYKID
jgi:hypothetical protein